MQDKRLFNQLLLDFLVNMKSDLEKKGLIPTLDEAINEMQGLIDLNAEEEAKAKRSLNTDFTNNEIL